MMFLCFIEFENTNTVFIFLIQNKNELKNLWEFQTATEKFSVKTQQKNCTKQIFFCYTGLNQNFVVLK